MWPSTFVSTAFSLKPIVGQKEKHLLLLLTRLILVSCIYTFKIKVFHLPVQKIIVIVITNRRFCTRDKPKSAQKWRKLWHKWSGQYWNWRATCTDRRPRNTNTFSPGTRSGFNNSIGWLRPSDCDVCMFTGTRLPVITSPTWSLPQETWIFYFPLASGLSWCSPWRLWHVWSWCGHVMSCQYILSGQPRSTPWCQQ